jgi:hypothetical protein
MGGPGALATTALAYSSWEHTLFCLMGVPIRKGLTTPTLHVHSKERYCGEKTHRWNDHRRV